MRRLLSALLTLTLSVYEERPEVTIEGQTDGSTLSEMSSEEMRTPTYLPR